jgi:hypothetical protein
VTRVPEPGGSGYFAPDFRPTNIGDGRIPGRPDIANQCDKSGASDARHYPLRVIHNQSLTLSHFLYRIFYTFAAKAT